MLSSSTIFSNIFSKHHPSFYIPAVFKSLSSTPSNYKSEQHLLLSKLRSAIFSDPPRLSDPTIRDFVLTVNEYSSLLHHLNESKSKLAQAESVNMDHLSFRKDLLRNRLRNLRAARTGDLVWYVPNHTHSHSYTLKKHNQFQVRCKIPKHDSVSSTHVKILSPQKTMSRFVFRALSNSILRRGFVSTSMLDSR